MTHLLITGVGRDIGHEIARQELERGWTVTVTLRGAGSVPEGGAVHRLDVTDRAALHTATAATEPVDILINNAGIKGPERQDPLDMDFYGFANTLHVNKLPPLAVAQDFLPNLRLPPERVSCRFPAG